MRAGDGSKPGAGAPPSAVARAAGPDPAPAVGNATGRPFWAGALIVGLALASGLVTFLLLTGLTPIVPTNEVVLWSLVVNALLLLVMVAVVFWQLRQLWLARRNKAAGSRLHLHIVSLLSVIALLPAIALLFASISLDRGLDERFSARTKAIVQNSLEVAQAYVDEAGQTIRSDIIAMARDLDDAAELVRSDPKRFRELLLTQSALRDLPYAYLVDESGKVLVTAADQPDQAYVAPKEAVLAAAKGGQVQVIGPGTVLRVGAVAKLANFRDTYLYVARPVNPRVIRHMQATERNVREYRQLEETRSGIQRTFGVMYAGLALTLLMAAIQIGLWFANRLVGPIRRLIGAAEEVSRGNLAVRVPIIKGEGDLRRLSSTFNRMTAELKTQRDDLVAANEQIGERRRFIEAVLSGITAGVLGLDGEGRITLANRSAEKLLGRGEAELVGRRLADALPEFAPLIEEARIDARKPLVHGQVKLMVGDNERTFALQLTREEAGEAGSRAVVTFDDITELLSAQRTSAWGEVARRMAHEIKNPLTPIQLSAERLKRKYGPAVTADRETFDKLTDTIVRQVGDIKSMVDEFASFARMPKPQMESQDMREAVQEPVLLFRESHPAITFEFSVPREPVVLMCDRRLLTQAITNLVKNATEAIQPVAEAKETEAGYRGRIATVLEAGDDAVTITVTDNGVGLPRQNRARLLEPYVTTRAKGTGLGLAIVQKIVEQHGGTLLLEDAAGQSGEPQRGARVRIVLPRLRDGRGERLGPHVTDGALSGRPENGRAEVVQRVAAEETRADAGRPRA